MEYLNEETLGPALFMLTSMVIGGTELVRRVFRKEWEAVSTIIVAALVGAVGGLFLLPSVGLVPGIVIGLSGSGVITGLQKIGPFQQLDEPIEVKNVQKRVDIR